MTITFTDAKDLINVTKHLELAYAEAQRQFEMQLRKLGLRDMVEVHPLYYLFWGPQPTDEQRQAVNAAWAECTSFENIIHYLIATGIDVK